MTSKENEKAVKLTAWQVLRNKFPESEYVLLSEVSDASGFSRSRSLDYMIINLWQSRGLHVTGIEKKSNRGDWLKEIKNPAKQENHFIHCDYFYLLTDKDNVAKIEEIPETWGWYHINGNNTLKTMKAAPKLNPLPIQRSLLCAMLRRAACKDNFVHVDTLEDTVQHRAEKLRGQYNVKLEREAKGYRELKDKVDAFEKSSGLNITDSWILGTPDKIGETVKLLMKSGIETYQKQLEQIEQRVKSIHNGILINLEKL